MILVICGFLFFYEFCAMFKQFAALVLLLAFLGQSFQRSFIMLDYYTNTDAYARYCINKAKLQD